VNNNTAVLAVTRADAKAEAKAGAQSGAGTGAGASESKIKVKGKQSYINTTKAYVNTTSYVNTAVNDSAAGGAAPDSAVGASSAGQEKRRYVNVPPDTPQIKCGDRFRCANFQRMDNADGCHGVEESKEQFMLCSVCSVAVCVARFYPLHFMLCCYCSTQREDQVWVTREHHWL
jgi:hypothetical protein